MGSTAVLGKPPGSRRPFGPPEIVHLEPTLVYLSVPCTSPWCSLTSPVRWLTQKGARQRKINEWLGIKNETEE